LEVAVQIYLGQQQPKVLKVERVNCRAEKITLPRDMLPVADDAGVVIVKLIVRYRAAALAEFRQTGNKLLDVFTASIL